MTRTRKFEEIVKGMNYVSVRLISKKASDVVLNTEFSSSVAQWPSDLLFSRVKVLDVPLTVKIRTGVQEKTNIAHKLIPEVKKWGVSMITVSHVKKRRSTREGFNLVLDLVVGLPSTAARAIQRAALH